MGSFVTKLVVFLDRAFRLLMKKMDGDRGTRHNAELTIGEDPGYMGVHIAEPAVE